MAIRKLNTRSDWLLLGTDISIDELYRYLETLSYQLQKLVKDYEKRIEIEANKIQDDQVKDEFYEWATNEHRRYSRSFPQILLNSFHVTSYSLFESEFYMVARAIGSKQKQTFNVSEIRAGGYLESAIYYINKLTGININNKTFSCLIGLKEGQRLRNIIVHSNGKVTEARDINIAKKCGVYNTFEKEVAITHDYCKNFISLLKAFFTELYKQTKTGDYL